MADGVVLWEGPSVLTGDPIVLIATGFDSNPSANDKTGSMVQTWILRQDVNPSEAAYGPDQLDSAICGSGENRCPFAKPTVGKRECYVKVLFAPRSVYNAYRAGQYPLAGDRPLAGRHVRLGAYGDPAAVPFDVWSGALVGSTGRTGYTHQWRVCDQRFALITMASVEDETSLDAAESAGWRGFYVGDAIPGRSLIHCPASAERGHRMQCIDCLACSGANPETAKRRSVRINRHR